MLQNKRVWVLNTESLCYKSRFSFAALFGFTLTLLSHPALVSWNSLLWPSLLFLNPSPGGTWICACVRVCVWCLCVCACACVCVCAEHPMAAKKVSVSYSNWQLLLGGRRQKKWDWESKQAELNPFNAKTHVSDEIVLICSYDCAEHLCGWCCMTIIRGGSWVARSETATCG